MTAEKFSKVSNFEKYISSLFSAVQKLSSTIGGQRLNDTVTLENLFGYLCKKLKEKKF